jgi:hypothetical protein
VGHGRDAFRGTQTCGQSAELSPQVDLTAPQTGGGHAEGGGRTVLDMPGASAEHLAPGNLIVRTQTQEECSSIFLSDPRLWDGKQLSRLTWWNHLRQKRQCSLLLSFRFLARGALRGCPEYIGELAYVVLSRVQVHHVEA